MKLSASYNLFDGEELLEYSLMSIRKNVDHISVVYQLVSNFGKKRSTFIKDLLDSYKSLGLIDEIYEYKPIINVHPHDNEIRKRNIGLQLAIDNGCTHYMSMDIDELYKLKDLKYAKSIIEDGDYDSSACYMLTYWREPAYRLEPVEDYYVSLIYKIRNGIEFVNGRKFTVLVDPTRRMDPGKCKLFTREECEMHHLSYIRNDIRSKFENSSARQNFNNQIDKLTDYYNKYKFPAKAWTAGAGCPTYGVVETEDIVEVIKEQYNQ